jgi:hypothetical protein
LLEDVVEIAELARVEAFLRFFARLGRHSR